MPPEKVREFGTAAGAQLGPLVLALLVVAVVLVLVRPRRYASAPLLTFTLLVPVGPAVVIGGASFFVARILALTGLARVLASRFGQAPLSLGGGYNAIDRAVVWGAVTQALATVALFGASAVVNQVGMLIDVLATYLVLRAVIFDEPAAFGAAKCLAVVVAIFAACMLVEHAREFNVFSILGGARVVPEFREGRVRAQAAFSHPLQAGTFAATLLPLFGIFWNDKKGRLFGLLGMGGAVVMVLTANSSTPLSAAAAGLGALALWPLRRHMRLVRGLTVAGIAILALVMKAPVWFLIARLDLTGSSSSYHRAALVDQTVRRVGEWWLFGVKDAGSWGYFMWDAQNQYVAIAQTGGLLPLVLFIGVIVLSFSRLGKAREGVAPNVGAEWRFWCLGASLFANVIGFLGINYFDQSRVGWLTLVAMISMMTSAGVGSVELTPRKRRQGGAKPARRQWRLPAARRS